MKYVSFSPACVINRNLMGMIKVQNFNGISGWEWPFSYQHHDSGGRNGSFKSKVQLAVELVFRDHCWLMIDLSEMKWI